MNRMEYQPQLTNKLLAEHEQDDEHRRKLAGTIGALKSVPGESVKLKEEMMEQLMLDNDVAGGMV